MTMTINLTTHPINLANGLMIPPSGHVARLDLTHTPVGDIDGIPVVRRVVGQVTGLPDNLPAGAGVIVSAQCADALLRQRPDLTVYTVGPTTRHADGRVTTASLVVAEQSLGTAKALHLLAGMAPASSDDAWVVSQAIQALGGDPA